MIRINITMTSKGYSSKDGYRIFHEETKLFPDMKAAKEWIKENYGKSKRVAMYQDRKDGTSYQCGYVIGFRNADMSHWPVEKWLQQDWISFSEEKPVEIKKGA